MHLFISVILTACAVLLLFSSIIIVWTIHAIYWLRQKTRTQQQRRMYGSSQRRRPTDPAEPTIFVSPANLPPPPKYEALAPPSYEEAVGVNYQEFQRTQVQPITFPLTHAATQAATEATNNSSDVNNDEQTVSQATLATITTVDERRTSVAQS
ncbi:uncharacterized protein LOC113509379 isoform X7 [Galleria mellonella]|uniref:Uncharacterized protein LOC113509379 isoform X7 n=1 Tax=Galleria mellonella TaxID=7137 RepID=A0A6J1W727_GALME|nr:uncharacterized protein LOC113509379 isoform X7 [Galleria mellonella]